MEITNTGGFTLIKIFILFLKILIERQDNSIELSPPPQSNSRSADQKIPLILWKTTIYYFVHRKPRVVPVLSQMNPLHVFPYYFSKVQFKYLSIYAWVFQVIVFL
jgi:hypothetical protein